jgi:1-acyl-sn-glycerol-3-phosphate acyltransferase
MLERIDICWRVLATGLCFALFGLGALALGVLVFPAVLLVVRDEARRRRAIRSLIQRSFRLFVGIMLGVGGFTLEIVGRERLGRPGQLIIANHPTLIDVVIIIALSPTGCVVKEALFRNPYLRRVVQAAGYISNAATGAMIDRAAEALRSGDTLLMFPEGTRTRPGEPVHFHRGAASVAVQSAVVLTPVYITTAPAFLPKSRPWYCVPRHRPHITLRVGEDVRLEEYRGLPPPKASRMLNEVLLAHYEAVVGPAGRYNESSRQQGPRTQLAAADPPEKKIDPGVAVNVD